VVRLLVVLWWVVHHLLLVVQQVGLLLRAILRAHLHLGVQIFLLLEEL
jgi:hypothetical protein